MKRETAKATVTCGQAGDVGRCPGIRSNSWSDRRHTQRPSPSVLVPVHSSINESVIKTSLRERVGLWVGPAVTGQAPGAWLRAPFDCHQAAGGSQDTPCLSQTGVEIGPVVHGGDRPHR